jgi:probable rRNA maturation factor
MKETMVSSKQGPVFHARGADGRRRALKTDAIELVWPDGRQLVISLPPAAWADVELHAEAPDATPVIQLQSAACNLLGMRLAVMHDTVEADLTPARLEMSIDNCVPKGEDDKSLRPKKRQIRAWAQAALGQDAVVGVRLVGEAEGRALNRDYRQKDYATNVLTFVYDETDGVLQGDLVICLPVVIREAQEQGKPVADHFAHLMVHGMLHLQGLDHEDDDEAALMEGLETDILARLGIADPYMET